MLVELLFKFAVEFFEEIFPKFAVEFPIDFLVAEMLLDFGNFSGKFGFGVLYGIFVVDLVAD